jgi:hypothetical protein
MIEGWHMEELSAEGTTRLVTWIAHHKVLTIAGFILLTELGLRRFAHQSRVYARWKATFEAIGSVWTAVLLSIIYVLSVGPIGLVTRLWGRDPLDRSLAKEPTFWRRHEPNPLGPEASVRHQF